MSMEGAAKTPQHTPGAHAEPRGPGEPTRQSPAEQARTAAAGEARKPTAEETRHAVSNTLKGSAGNLIEWFDLYIYAAFSGYFATAFFDKSDPVQSQIDAYLGFALTFLMRPVGSWFFGRYADRHGRKAALTLSISLMALGSLILAILPGRDTIGVWALVILYMSRLLQGFSLGGEYGTSATYMSEVATRNRRGFFSSFQYVTLVGGQVLALLTLIILQNVLTSEQLHAWGWRIPFILGAVGALVVLWLRRSMDESLEHDKIAAATDNAEVQDAGTLKVLFTQYWRPLLLTVMLTLGGTVAFYTYTTYILSYMNNVSGIPKEQTSVINFAALFLFMCLQPVAGLLSDKIGRKALLVAFGVGGTLFTWPILGTLANVKSPMVAFLLMAAGLVITVGYTSISALVKAELFPAKIRALGVGLGYAIANSLFGGTIPFVGAYMNSHNMRAGFITYVTVCIAISLVVYLFFLPKNKSRTVLDDEQGHAYAEHSTAGTRRTGAHVLTSEEGTR
ncbi:MFS transporter [Falsarthrobacter nasiphocae]|uniref:Alpha-ketoglutarate permease n=1 Tax=Falsarthrobacter nasiphocae TaxID=189863 RepID=A0AAE4C695_9MICC|nr:MFS transporter [Falsarthrobacter nasiphocae]MDR6891907.1 MHS family alpha-ketoglutarate permease-like MFS transporter [Falsarthrobacter nasiphocae]